MLLRRIIFFVVSILLGLLSRSEFVESPTFVNAYIGDVLWAFMVFWLCSLIFIKRSLRTVLYISLIFSFTIELTQLYHAPWIDAIRDVKLFALILGHGFLWSDLVCYSIGIFIGFLLETMFVRNKK